MNIRISHFPRNSLLLAVLIIPLLPLIYRGIPPAIEVQGGPEVLGPNVHPRIAGYQYNGSLLDLAVSESAANLVSPAPLPLKYVPGTEPKGASDTIASWNDPLAQTAPGAGQLPGPLISFDGMRIGAGGSLIPPDANGDIGPNHYIQTVNPAMAIYDKTNGDELVRLTLNQFFQGTGTICDYLNRGDPIVVYDRFVDRWLITDFAWSDSGGPYYECLAFSQSGDPVSGGWYFYAIEISEVSLNDYPKVGVWRDGYYLSFNMFYNYFGGWYWDGVQVWAFEKTALMSGTANTISFSLLPSSGYASLLPAHALSEPPSGAPNYFASLSPPDNFYIWEFQADWATPANSTFTGPTLLDVADFAMAASVPQKGSTVLVDSLSYRPMMQFIYRTVEGVESLWLNHTVASQGVAGIRWYEVRDPGSSPILYQQGTYQPDLNHRWMGSLAVDQDGNMAVGYSVSSADIYPAISYTGRLASETTGTLPQGENSLIQGSGAQTGSTRWGDYTSMSVDPDDECTFWYNNEYYTTFSNSWRTRIGAFKFPSCGQNKGILEGTVRDANSMAPIPGLQVVAASPTLTTTVVTASDGFYSMTLTADVYSVTAGPQPPGYPTPVVEAGVVISEVQTTTQDLLLTPMPYLIDVSQAIDDNVPGGNGNGYPEPGETGLLFWEDVQNTGATTSTQVIASLSSSTPGVVITDTGVTYPNIPAGQTRTNANAFEFGLDQSIPCGTELLFHKTITDSLTTYHLDFSLNASVPLPRQDVFSNDVESGAAGWTTGGSPNTWAITSASSHSPSHSWTDSPGGNYSNNSSSYVRTPTYNLVGAREVKVSAWVKYALEAGYDFAHLEYSLNNGASWAPLLTLNGYQASWQQFSLDAPMLEGEPSVALRFRFISDSSITYDGIYVDDIAMSWKPYTCIYGLEPAAYFPIIFQNYSP